MSGCAACIAAGNPTHPPSPPGPSGGGGDGSLFTPEKQSFRGKRSYQSGPGGVGFVDADIVEARQKRARLRGSSGSQSVVHNADGTVSDNRYVYGVMPYDW